MSYAERVEQARRTFLRNAGDLKSATDTLIQQLEWTRQAFEAIMHIAYEYTLIEEKSPNCLEEAQCLDNFSAAYYLLSTISYDSNPVNTACSNKTRQFKAWLSKERSVGHFNAFNSRKRDSPQEITIMEWMRSLDVPELYSLTPEEATQFTIDAFNEQSSVLREIAHKVVPTEEKRVAYADNQLYKVVFPYFRLCLDMASTFFDSVRITHDTKPGELSRVHRIFTELMSDSPSSAWFNQLTDKQVTADQAIAISRQLLRGPEYVQLIRRLKSGDDVYADLVRQTLLVKIASDEQLAHVNSLSGFSKRMTNMSNEGEMEIVRANAEVTAATYRQLAPKSSFDYSNQEVESAVELASMHCGLGMEWAIPEKDELVSRTERLMPFVPQNRYYRRCAQQRLRDDKYGLDSAKMEAASRDMDKYATPLAKQIEMATDNYLCLVATARADNIELIEKALQFCVKYELATLPVQWDNEMMIRITQGKVTQQPDWHRDYIKKLHLDLVSSPEFAELCVLEEVDSLAASAVMETGQFLTETPLSDNAVLRVLQNPTVAAKSTAIERSGAVKTTLRTQMSPATTNSRLRTGRDISSTQKLTPGTVPFAATAAKFDASSKDPLPSWETFTRAAAEIRAKMPFIDTKESFSPLKQYQELFPTMVEPINGYPTQETINQVGMIALKTAMPPLKDFYASAPASYFLRVLCAFALQAVPKNGGITPSSSDVYASNYVNAAGNTEGISLETLVKAMAKRGTNLFTQQVVSDFIDGVFNNCGPQLAFWTCYCAFHYLEYIKVKINLDPVPTELLRSLSANFLANMLTNWRRNRLDSAWYSRKFLEAELSLKNELKTAADPKSETAIASAAKKLASTHRSFWILWFVATSAFDIVGMTAAAAVSLIKKAPIVSDRTYGCFNDPVLIKTTQLSLRNLNLGIGLAKSAYAISSHVTEFSKSDYLTTITDKNNNSKIYDVSAVKNGENSIVFTVKYNGVDQDSAEFTRQSTSGDWVVTGGNDTKNQGLIDSIGKIDPSTKRFIYLDAALAHFKAQETELRKNATSIREAFVERATTLAVTGMEMTGEVVNMAIGNDGIRPGDIAATLNDPLVLEYLATTKKGNIINYMTGISPYSVSDSSYVEVCINHALNVAGAAAIQHYGIPAAVKSATAVVAQSSVAQTVRDYATTALEHPLVQFVTNSPAVNWLSNLATTANSYAAAIPVKAQSYIQQVLPATGIDSFLKNYVSSNLDTALIASIIVAVGAALLTLFITRFIHNRSASFTSNRWVTYILLVAGLVTLVFESAAATPSSSQ